VTCGGIDRIEADGDVSYMTPTQAVRADSAVYAADADQIVLQGHVVVGQGKNVVEGDRLVIQISAHHALIESATPGAAGDSSRVHGVFNLGESGKTK
jgi:lipopolysaccharide export system protein LptA